jgi:hypothetical protein
VEETYFGIRLADGFVVVTDEMRTRRSVHKREPTGTASIVAHAQEQGAAARLHELARLVADFDFRIAIVR